MSAQIKEALAALDVIESQSVPIWHLHDRARACLALRSALEAAQQEAKDCKTIQEWQAAYKARRAELRIDMYFTLLLSQGTGNWSMPFDAIERAKAVHDAAEWIRKEGT